MKERRRTYAFDEALMVQIHSTKRFHLQSIKSRSIYADLAAQDHIYDHSCQTVRVLKCVPKMRYSERFESFNRGSRID
jgi:hypothetical protein